LRLRILTALALLLIITAGPALSHPHVWVDAASELVFDDAGEVVAVRHHWRFDEAFSAYALQGLDVDRDGTYSAEELKPLAQENVESLSEFDFFTFLTAGNDEAQFAAPKDYYLELYDDRLLLHFTLPLAVPFKPRGTMVLEVYDPEYFVAFSLPNEEAVRLVDAPEACELTVYPAQELDADAAAALATIGADQRELPPEMKALTAGVENSAEVNCGGSAAPQSAADAATRMAQSGGEVGDLTALPAAPSTDEPPAATTSAEAPSGPSLSARLMARITAWQTAFNRDLTAALKALRDGGAFWWLGGISFLYGIVHAAGPGHGKVVISTYLVANEARVRRGVVIAFIAALAQAVVAVALIGVMAMILNMTSMAIDNTAKAFEAGSFALVAVLGVYLLVRKGRETWALLQGGEAHSHDHGHGHHHHGHGAHACHHHAAPIETKPGLSGAAAAVLSVGVRPCSGALVVLVFALAQGVFWAGVASTFLMALGTAITVAALAALAVGAKGVARRLARSGGSHVPTYAMLGLELAAALFITALGAVLFAGALYA
jgi:nickel/cobalt exporter